MRIPSISTLAAIVMLFFCCSVDAKPKTFEVNDKMGRDVVSFNSNAPIELIVGRTSKITGSVTVDDSLSLKKHPMYAEFNVDLSSIDTGIEMRNKHMRDNFLETDTYPIATFKLSRLKSKDSTLRPGQTLKLTARGEFTVHGKTIAKEIPVSVTYFPPCPPEKRKSQACDAITIRATFPVALQEHNIKKPEMLMQKLADTIFVTVSATARAKDVTEGSSSS